MASVMLGVIKFFITHFLSYGTAVAAVLPCRRHRSAPALTTFWTATAGGVRLTAEPSPAPYALRCTGPAPGPQAFAPGLEAFTC
jgi:hypothetical protein